MVDHPIAVSSWALHQVLGQAWWHSPSQPLADRSVHSEEPLPLLELPAALRDHGFDRLELCHFHLPSQEPAALDLVRAALDEWKVTLQTLLIDDGDITHPETGQRDADWIATWIDSAAVLGAQRVRVIAGKQAGTAENLELARLRLAQLAERASSHGLQLVIENWFDLLKTPASVDWLLESLKGQVELCLDFGNWGGPTKYEDLAAIAPWAKTCHAKAEFTGPGQIDQNDYHRCLKLLSDSRYQGPMVLVNGGPADNWDALDLNRAEIRAFTG